MSTDEAGQTVPVMTPHEDAELVERARQEAQRRREQEEREQRRVRHWMHCPSCGGDMATEPLHEVRVLMCKDCAGLWIDRATLTALAESSGAPWLQKYGDILMAARPHDGRVTPA